MIILKKSLELVESLAVRSRPRLFSEVVGNDTNIKTIQGFLKKGQLPRTWLFNGASGSGKCFRKGTLVSTTKGLFEIQDLVGDNEGFTEKEIDVYTKDGIDTTSHVYMEKKCKTIKITTSYGYNIEGTYDHPVYVFNPDLTFSWKKLKNIKEGDVICFNKQPYFSQGKEVELKTKSLDFNNYRNIIKKFPKKCDADFARFIGYLIANGSFGKGNYVDFATNNITVQKDYIRVVKNLFNIDIEFKEKTSGGYSVTINSLMLCDFMKQIMVLGVAKEKEIPPCILQSPSNIIKEFLTAYISCDSTIDTRNGKKAPALYLCTASKKLANQLHIILLHFGAIGNLYSTKGQAYNSPNPVERTYYEIAFSAYHSKIIFDMLPLLKEVKKKDIYLVNEFYPGFIFDEYQKMQDKYGDATGHYRLHDFDWPTALRAKLCINYATTIDVFPRAITKKHYEKFCGQYELIKLIDPVLGEKLEKIYNYDFFYDSVKVIQYSKKKKTVYDLTLPKTHNFISNGFISHNTTSARILAMTVNCENIGDNLKKGIVEPCLECRSCKLALQNKHPDIIEINAGGEEGNAQGIRDILDAIKLAPRFNVKTIIIDECHNLSSTAKQNLLKPLEEPPKHVLWELCTTDPEKLPLAALNRCIKLYFEYPSIEVASKHIWKTAKQEFPDNIAKRLKPYIKKITQSVNGQLRDCYSVMESLASILEADPDIDKDSIDDEFVKVLTNLGELTTPAIRFIAFALASKWTVPLEITADIDPSRLQEFLNVLARHTHYASLYFSHKREGTLENLRKQKFYGINFTRFDKALDDCWNKMTKYFSAKQIQAKMFGLTQAVMEVIVKHRQGLLTPEQAIVTSLSEFALKNCSFESEPKSKKE